VCSRQQSPKACGGALPNRGDQPGGRYIKEQARAFGVEPGPQVKPAKKTEMIRLRGEIAVPVGIADLYLMLVPGRPALEVTRKTIGVSDLQLATHILDDPLRDVLRVGKKGSKESERGELKRETEAIVIASTPPDENTIGVIEVKVAGQLRGGGVIRKASVKAFLLLGQKINGQ